MTVEDIINDLRKNRRQARQLHPNAMVVSWEAAKKAIHKAYQEGANSGVETTVAATQKTVCYDKETERSTETDL